MVRETYMFFQRSSRALFTSNMLSVEWVLEELHFFVFFKELLATV